MAEILRLLCSIASTKQGAPALQTLRVALHMASLDSARLQAISQVQGSAWQ